MNKDEFKAALTVEIENLKKLGFDDDAIKNVIEIAHQDGLDKFITRIEKNCENLTKSLIVAIYDEHEDVQIGSGFLVEKNGRAVLVTAKHCLLGKCYDQDPLKKRVFLNGLKRIEDLESHDVKIDPANDIAVLYVNEYPISRCVSIDKITSPNASSNFISIHGYLGREFKACVENATLLNAPWIYTNPKMVYKDGYPAMKFDRRKFVEKVGANPKTAPRPEGLSGCPMLDSEALYKNEVSIIGVFTDQPKKIGFGESSEKILKLISELP